MQFKYQNADVAYYFNTTLAMSDSLEVNDR